MNAIFLITAALLAGPEAGKQFLAMDADRDGKVSAAEHAAGAKTMFETMDMDHDGIVTAAEMTAAHKAVTGQAAKPGDMAAADKIKAVDDNGDGTLSAEEHAAGSKAMFARMDADKDGWLTKQEMAAGHAAMLRK